MNTPISIAIALMLVLLLSGNALASKCKDLEAALMHREAAECYHKATVANPKNPENHYMLGMMLLKLGQYSRAQDSFKSAVAMDAQQNHLVNPAISYIDSSRLGEVKNYLDVAAQKNPSVKNKLANDIFNNGQNKLKEGKIEAAKNLFEFAIEYNGGLRSRIFTSLSNAGENANYREAPIYFDLAKKYITSDVDRRILGLHYLRLAVAHWPNKSYELAKSQAEEMLGIEKVLEVFPLPYDEVIFDKTFTNADPKDAGGDWISVLVWSDKFRVGDKIEVFAELPEDAKDARIFRGKEFSPKWYSVNDYFFKYLENINQGNHLAIWIDPEKNTKARVKITRKTTPKPNLSNTK